MDCTGRQLSSTPGNLRGDTEELFLDDNTIQVLSNASLLLYPQLWHLSLTRNRLELIEPGAFLSSQGLEVLSLTDNLNLSSLRLLDMSQNQVWGLPDDFLEDPLAMLTELDLSQNQLVELGVKVGFGDILPNLQLFNLSTNRLQALPPGIFTHSRRITTLDLSRNRVDLCPQPGEARSLPCVDIRGVETLTHLSLAGCGLQGLSSRPFQGTSLRHLDLSDNRQVLSGDLGWLQDLVLTLQVLSLRNTSLSPTAVDFSALHSLVRLDLSGNSLAAFPASLGALRLRSLDLRDNLFKARLEQARSSLM
uniref:Toll-like receptor 12 n=1 Tax=Zosterops lateralis melanops TaxID=1220523 RepID=A0A8D2NZ95_ZOSLA